MLCAQRVFASILLTFCLTISAAAQSAWVQVEAQPSLAQAQERVRDYAQFLPDVNGFALGGGWYGIALGPYGPADAAARLRQLRRDGNIPRDSFVALGDNYRQQFWPIGAGALSNVEPLAPTTIPTTIPTTTPEPATDAPVLDEDVVEAAPVIAEPVFDVPQVPEYIPDETVAEARRSEQALSRDEKLELQTALKWAGFYTAAIDGAFGRGTRRSMAAYQDAQDWPATGVLTTAQRTVLFKDYNAVLEGLGFQTVQDVDAGISVKMPTAMVKFEKFEPPFVHYSMNGDPLPKVLLISQSGTQDSFAGLYDIIQTLEVVPLDGPRDRKGGEFEITGRNDTLTSYTFARLQRGEIKGFVLIWPTGDDARLARIVQEMRTSFRALDGVLDDALSDPSDQGVNLLSGMELRTPQLSRSGFFVDAAGTVVTTASVVQSCGRITLDDVYEATVSYSDAASGLAILKPITSLAPASFASFQTEVPRLSSEVAVAGYSYDGLLGAPTVTFGRLSDIRDLGGNDKLDRLAMLTLPGDAGGPVMDRGGAVLGMLLPRAADQDRNLPDDVQFSVDAAVIKAALENAGIAPRRVEHSQNIAPADLSVEARGITVLVSCWDQ